jgi:hypothetical protein
MTGIPGFAVINDADLHSVTIGICNKKRYQKKYFPDSYREKLGFDNMIIIV